MKRLRLSAIIILSLICLIAFAQAVKDVNSSVGNGNAMKQNMNEPNAVNPANHNIQKYERCGTLEANSHPEKNLGNDYNSQSYQK